MVYEVVTPWIPFLLITITVLTLEHLFVEKITARKTDRVLFHSMLYALNLAVCGFFFQFALGHRLIYTDKDGWLRTALTVLIFDFIAYCLHRLSHRINILWRFHQVHHSDPLLDSTTALREHVGQTLITTALYALSIYLLEPSYDDFRLFLILSFGFSLLTHSKLRLPLEKYFAWIFVTPMFHEKHHRLAGFKGGGFHGAIFSVWDRLLGTASERSHGVFQKDTSRMSLKRVLQAPFLAFLFFFCSSTSVHAGSCSSPLTLPAPLRQYNPFWFPVILAVVFFLIRAYLNKRRKK